MKKIIILGSTGSIGKQTLSIIRKNIKNFKVVLLSTDKNVKQISKQIKIFNVKNVIVTNKKSHEIIQKRFKKIKVFQNFDNIDKIVKNKVDYTMSAISGLRIKTNSKIIKKQKELQLQIKSHHLWMGTYK